MMRTALLALLTVTAFATPAHAWEVLGQCPGPIGTHWKQLPTEWKLCDKLPGARSYYSHLDDSAVYDAFQSAWEEWSDPQTCTTSFEAVYAGETYNGAEASSSENVVEFVEGVWPWEHGDEDVTIATTIWMYRGTTCELFQVDQLYNGVGFEFTTTGSPSKYEPDLQSIAAHENGHWLGLDHSGISAAVLRAKYDGTVVWRSLHSDDEDGVCTLYPDCEWCEPGSVEGSGASDDDPVDCGTGCDMRRLHGPVPFMFAAFPLVFLVRRRRP
ncbi:MAG: matrixin family metalloprotease [Deltaproteobacteria bacterium]|nr:matrixin family metalloprotease [Deltaproteobacteria bacterium]